MKKRAGAIALWYYNGMSRAAKSPNSAICNSKRNILLKILAYCDILKASIFGGVWMKSKLSAEGASQYRSLEGMTALYKQIDEQASAKRSSENVKYICQKGCCSCCSDYFTISKVEYFAIKHFLSASGRSLNELQEKARAQLELFREKHPDMSAVLADKTNTFSAFDDSSITKFSPCALLENGSCSVYPARPIICRLYGISYSYSICDKVLARCFKLFHRGKIDDRKVLRHMIDLPYSCEYMEGIDFVKGNEAAIVQKPYPIFWWLANDADYQDEYEKYIAL